MAEISGRITLWGLEVFVITAEEGAISAAARRLMASPSAISQQLTALELALGTPLLDRSTRPVTLTPAGQMFRKRARLILAEAEQARAELTRKDFSGLTQLRLGMIEDFDGDVTPHLLSDMANDLTGCQFLLETGASHRLLDQLDARALDVVVATDMAPPPDWAEVHPLMCEPFVAAVPQHLARQLAHSGADLLGALQELPLIHYTSRHYMGRVIKAHLAHENLRLSHRFELDSYHAIMAMVARGAGWTILTPLGFHHAQRFSADADMLPLPFAPLSRTISLSARAGTLHDMPGTIATRLRALLGEHVVGPTLARYGWLRNDMRVL